MNHLYSSYSVGGDVIFENDRWIICHTKSTPFDTEDADTILRQCQKTGIVHTNGKLTEYFAPRNCAFLAVSKAPFVYLFEDNDIGEITKQCVTAAMGSPLVAFDKILTEARNGAKTFDSRLVFHTAHIKGDTLTYAHAQLNPAGTVGFSHTADQFNIYEPKGNTGKATGICFSNNFEMVYIPLEDEGKALACIKRVIDRSNLPGRVAADYIVMPVIWDEPQACIRVRPLENMSTKEMMAHFGLKKKSGTKMETLAACLASWENRVPFMEVGDFFFVQINTQAPETPIDVEPTDWILSRSSHYEIVASDQSAPEAIDMFIKIVDKPCDDFAAALYTMFEAQQKPVNIVGLNAEKVKMLFQEVRNRVNSASKV